MVPKDPDTKKELERAGLNHGGLYPYAHVWSVFDSLCGIPFRLFEVMSTLFVTLNIAQDRTTRAAAISLCIVRPLIANVSESPDSGIVFCELVLWMSDKNFVQPFSTSVLAKYSYRWQICTSSLAMTCTGRMF